MKKLSPEIPEQLQKIVEIFSEKKIENMVVLDVSKIAGYTDFFLIGTGLNAPHVQAMADAAVAILKKPGVAGARMEGFQSGTWVLLDGGDFVIHLFQPDARKFYALEDLWGDAPKLAIKD